MKKILFFLLLIIMIPVVFAKDNVSIEKIELVSKGDNVVENSKPTFKGLEMNYDIAFKKVGDSIKYKVTVKNSTSNDYKIASETSFSKSNYLKYEYEVEDVLKSKGSVDVLVTITYNKEIPADKFVNDRYDEANKATVKLLTMENEEVNPKTTSGSLLVLILVLFFIAYMGVVLLINKKISVKNVSILIISGMMLIPIISKALEEIRLTLNVKVEILRTYKVIYHLDNHVLITKEEKESRDDWKGCYTYYIGDKVEENRRYHCIEEKVYEDPNRYYAGETVVPLGDLYFIAYNKWAGLCQYYDGYAVCTRASEANKINQSVYRYSYELNAYYNNMSEENDSEYMNFRHSSSDYDEGMEFIRSNDSGITFYKTIIFTMPKHDVHLTPELPG